MLIGPAEIADRAEIDESDLELVGRLLAPGMVPGMMAATANAAAAAAAAAVATTLISCSNSGFFDGWCGCPDAAPARAQPVAVQRSGTNTRPNEAGAADPARPRPRDIATSTITVARYGKDDMNCEGMRQSHRLGVELAGS